jgi:hypothetical protein
LGLGASGAAFVIVKAPSAKPAASPCANGSSALSKTPVLATPFDDGDGSLPDEVEVTDPTHPLFGRHFKIDSVRGGSEDTACVFVEYSYKLRLKIFRRSTNLSLLATVGPRVKLSADAVAEFLTLVKEYELCPPRQGKSGKVSARRSKRKLSRS